MSVRERLDDVRARIARAEARCGRAGAVKLIAVSKTQPASAIREAFEAGQRAFGENYVQELVAKARELTDLEIEWHFIGHLQRNKVKDVVSVAHVIHTIDREALAAEISKRASADQRVLLEVNVASEPQKSGVEPSSLGALADAVRALPNLSLEGVMAVPPAADDAEATRPHFRELARLAAELAIGPELSMGMSGDFEVAIEEGATLVRVGTSIFGPRSYAR